MTNYIPVWLCRKQAKVPYKYIPKRIIKEATLKQKIKWFFFDFDITDYKELEIKFKKWS